MAQAAQENNWSPSKQLRAPWCTLSRRFKMLNCLCPMDLRHWNPKLKDKNKSHTSCKQILTCVPLRQWNRIIKKGRSSWYNAYIHDDYWATTELRFPQCRQSHPYMMFPPTNPIIISCSRGVWTAFPPTGQLDYAHWSNPKLSLCSLSVQLVLDHYGSKSNTHTWRLRCLCLIRTVWKY